MWRTGAAAYDQEVGQALGFGEGAMIVGFLYLGTPDAMPRPREPIDFGICFSRWPPAHPA
jgi:hypothetical protein